MSITPESIIDDLENDRLPLPTLPEVAIRVRETADDENASITDVAKIIETDAALSARIVQVGNDADLGHGDLLVAEDGLDRRTENTFELVDGRHGASPVVVSSVAARAGSIVPDMPIRQSRTRCCAAPGQRRFLDGEVPSGGVASRKPDLLARGPGGDAVDRVCLARVQWHRPAAPTG